MDKLPKIVVVFRFNGDQEQLEAALSSFAETQRISIETTLGAAVDLKAKIVRRSNGIYEFYPKFASTRQPTDPAVFSANLRSLSETQIVTLGGTIL